MQKLIGRVRAAVEKYQLIEEGDKIAVGVSGGKDSLFLLCALAELSRYYPKHFTVTAITADPCFGGKETDFSISCNGLALQGDRKCLASGRPPHRPEGHPDWENSLCQNTSRFVNTAYRTCSGKTKAYRRIRLPPSPVLPKIPTPNYSCGDKSGRNR